MDDEDFPKCSSLYSFTKERIAAKVKNIRKNFKKAVDMGRRSGGEKIVMSYYSLCCDIWAGAPATKSIEGEYTGLKPGLYFVISLKIKYLNCKLPVPAPDCLLDNPLQVSLQRRFFLNQT